MTGIAFSKEETRAIVADIQRFFHDEMDQQIGVLPSTLLLDFISARLGPYFYNRGLYDAQAAFSNKMDDVSDAIYGLEQKPASYR